MTSTPKVIAGAEVSRGGAGGVLSRSRGTASLIVSDGTNHYAITCAHVLGRPGLIDPAMDTVYSPRYKSCCGIENKPFGTVVRSTLDQTVDTPAKRIQKSITAGGNAYAIDAAAIQIATGAAWSNAVSDAEIGMIVGVRDLTTELGAASFAPGATTMTDTSSATLEIGVTKYGATTDLTHGMIRRLTTAATFAPDSGGHYQAGTGFLFEVDADPTETRSDTYVLDMARTTSELFFATAQAFVDDLNSAGAQLTATLGGSATAPTVTISGATFSKPGDSGAPIVDKAHRVVGLLTSGTVKPLYVVGQADPIDVFLGRSQGVLIAPALAALSAVMSTPTTVTLAFAPGASSAGAARIVPGMPIALGLDRADDAAIARAEAALRATARGARLEVVVRAHIDEIRQLVHHRRRVTVAWHRARGPAFVASALRGSTQPGWPLAAELDGVTVEAALSALRAALAAEGSPALRDALVEHGDALIALVAGARSVGDVIARLEP